MLFFHHAIRGHYTLTKARGTCKLLSQLAELISLSQDFKMLPINIHTYVHDTVQETNDKQLEYLFFSVFTPELSEITGREVTVTFHRNVPGITDFSYAHYSDCYSNLCAFAEAISADLQTAFAACKANSPRPAKLTDIDLLLIDGYLVKSLKVEGIALPEANIACATTFGRVVVAHEVGHCLGATHEDAALYRDTEFNDPNHCATFMATQRPEWTCALFGYSAENRYNIHNYLKDAP